jgi:L-serine dehydratase
MRAARRFAAELRQQDLLARTTEVRVDLYGSLAATGDGHGTPGAIMSGLRGDEPESVDIAAMRSRLAAIEETGVLRLMDGPEVPFRNARIVRHPLTVLDGHPNGMRFAAYANEELLTESTWFSIGGGFVIREGEDPAQQVAAVPQPMPFTSAAELLEHCGRHGIAPWEVMRSNELAVRSEDEVAAALARIADAMRECVDNGLSTEGTLPGGLDVNRRAKAWHDALQAEADPFAAHLATEWLNVVALAVNEENAAGGRVVTAPTNGAAGIVPSVLFYALAFLPTLARGTAADRANAVERYLLTAGAIGSIYKARASISGAEVGCQGEVGSASSMAAAGMAELLGGTPSQIENAAEIAMEHNLGLTCDPVGGLVQIPCIERNAIASAKAVNAATMAMRGDGTHRVSLDQVIETMRQTGADMSDMYKETSRGGLAVNVIEC